MKRMMQAIYFSVIFHVVGMHYVNFKDTAKIQEYLTIMLFLWVPTGMICKKMIVFAMVAIVISCNLQGQHFVVFIFP